uniref:Phosphodiesterase n=1 Tax=Angiostrongylus cantonensis TaxID=6313 RepID=A0A158P8A5_ANGCA
MHGATLRDRSTPRNFKKWVKTVNLQSFTILLRDLPQFPVKVTIFVEVRILYELAQCCAQIANTDLCELYVQNEEGVFLVHKEAGEPHFPKILLGICRDKQIINVICTWVAAELERTGSSSEVFARQRRLNSFLLDVAKSIFHDIVSMDTVIIKVMNFAAKLVDADRASLFLVDNKNQELYARIFDVGREGEELEGNSKEEHKEIRFSMKRGIAGHVALTGEGLNIENAYEDHRFNPEVDTKTGYTTKTILCMPIFIRGSVIGVVQMVNKREGVFTKDDEDSFEMFAVYCGLALHHAKLYDKIRRSEQKYRVALEVLAYHSVCNKDEVAKLQKMEIKDHVFVLLHYKNIVVHNFNYLRMSELEKPLYAIAMFKELFQDKFRYDRDELIRFVLTVRKNYRRVAYHNWAHGWSVAHAMFVVLIQTSKDIFTTHEALALYVSCLCHDLDHRGKNNAYMKSMMTPLASIYTTSVMEHHHFNQTVTILQQDGHNILKSMTSSEYKQALSLIKHCILATDLALFFTNKAELNKIIDSGIYDINNSHHRKLTQAIMMTGCDLIASAKPWYIQTETVKVIFEEFYEQGDAERLNGRDPIPMMDRNKAHELPQMQVGFMRGICLPCYELIAKVLPEASFLRDQCDSLGKHTRLVARAHRVFYLLGWITSC